MTKYHVYGVGNALVDMEFAVQDPFFEQLEIAKGLMTLVDEKRQIEILAYLGHKNGTWACGGSAANTIIAVSYFGGRAFYSCKVANDELGDFYLEDMRTAGVDSNINGSRSEGETGRCLVMVTPDAERTMNTFLGITESLSLYELNEAAIKASEYLYMEGYLVASDTGREAAIRAREIAQHHGVKTALTFSDPAMVEYFRDGLQEMVGQGVDLLFCNESEARAWTGAQDIDQAVEGLKPIAGAFAITLGSSGAVVYDGTQTIHIAPHPITAVDSNGAGDMFAGAFLYALTHGHTHESAGNFASAAAAKVVSKFGPRLDAEEYTELLQLALH